MQLDDEAVELWGGIECTINRINDKYFDQLEYSGHYNRKNDIDVISELGIKALRYPVLWERHQPSRNAKISWAFAKKNLTKLQSLKIEPIIGLVHHGSGPAFVDFFNGSFESGLAEYAYQVALQFPWVKYYTPVNEPLTTARFCGLYGHWYPHKRDDYSFAKILLSECKATVMAMRKIREVNPDAKLIQTEDLTRIYSTPLLKYQADFENDRKWLAFDLIAGRVAEEHPLWGYLKWCGIKDDELNYFRENNCCPDIIGLNYYITSQRYLDENVENYPPHTHGKNCIHEYADVEAVRVNFEGMWGAYKLFKEAWSRFHLPLAVTEVHLHCHREEQMRWFLEIWQTVKQLKKEGVDIKAVTAWALLGSFGWNRILTNEKGDYEPGVFDVRSKTLQRLAMADMLQSIARNQHYYHPVLQGKGWWRRDIRFVYNRNENVLNIDEEKNKNNSQPLLILGKTGTLGNSFARICEHRNIHYKLFDRTSIDICNPVMIEKLINELDPWAIVNAAGYVKVDDAESHSYSCFLANSFGPMFLAKYCNQYNVQLLTFSSDLVFNGKKRAPYFESDKVNPLSIYGYSKVIAEQNVQSQYPESLIIRTSAFFGPWDRWNFVTLALQNLKKGKHFAAANDIIVSPTYIPDLVNTSLDLLIDRQKGIWHISNNGEITWAELATMAAEKFSFAPELVLAKPSKELQFSATRPGYSVLQSEKGISLPSLYNALDRYTHDIDPQVFESAELVHSATK